MVERTIDDLIQSLREGEFEAQEQAAEQLAAVGDAAVTPLLNVLRAYSTWDDYEANQNPQHLAEAALIKIGEPAVLSLIQALDEPGWGAVHGAIYALGEIGDVRAVQPLIEVMRADDVNVTTDVAETLLKFGEIAVRPLIYALKHEETAVRRGAAYILGLFHDPTAASALINALKDEAAEVRISAAQALGTMVDARAVEPLIAALGDENPAAREAMVRALGEIGLKLNTPSITRALVRAMHDADWGTRQSAAEMLLRAEGAYSPAARDLLLFDLHKDDVEVRLGAAWSLIPLKEPQALAVLTQLLSDADAGISSRAALGLGEYGERRSIPPLLDLLSHSDSQVRHAAQTALHQLGHDAGE